MARFKEGEIIVFKGQPYTIMLVFMDMYVCASLADKATVSEVVEEMYIQDTSRFEYLDDAANIELYDYGFKDILEDVAKEE